MELLFTGYPKNKTLHQMRRFLFFILAFYVVFVSCNKRNAEQVINITEFGIAPNMGVNVTPLINDLIISLDCANPVKIVFPQGRYDFFPDSNFFREYYMSNVYDINPKRLATVIDNKKNLTIDGQGSEFVFHGHIQPFTFDNADNITIKNLSIDWDFPLTAEAEVMVANNNKIILKIDSTQFPFSVHELGVTFYTELDIDADEEWRVSGRSWIIEFDKNRLIPPATGEFGCINGDLENVKYSKTKDGLLQLTGIFTRYPSVGNYIIMRHSMRDHAGVFSFHSRNLVFENINMYHTSGLGFLFQYCENISLTNVNVVPNPAKNRFLSSHADGFHFSGCKGEIQIDNCRFEGLMDDPVNVHGTNVEIVGIVDSKTLMCRFKHSMSVGLAWAQKGDQIGFINNKTMATFEKGVIENFIILNKDSMLVGLENDISDKIQMGFALENLTWTPDVTITNCFAGSNRARGFLISTPGDVLVKNNIFQTSGAAILIAGDANKWYESGAVKNVQIIDNEFRAPCNSSYYEFDEAVISIFPEIPDPDANLPFHKNIIIKNNVFHMSDYPLLYALSVDSLIFSGNTVNRSYLFEPWHFNKQTFTLDACKNVIIQNNYFDKNLLGKNIVVKRMDIKTTSIQDDLTVHIISD
jgi:hypothetical protein